MWFMIRNLYTNLKITVEIERIHFFLLTRWDSLHKCNSREISESLLIDSRSRICGKLMLQS